MDLLGSLTEEHRLIVAVMSALEAFVARIEAPNAIDNGELLRFVIFLSDFADAWHHGREEQVLIPAMTRHGYKPNSGVFAHIREQHRCEKGLLVAWRHAAAETAPWSTGQLERFRGLTRDLLSLEREHIEKEATVFYPDAAKELALEPASLLHAAVAQFSETQMSGEQVKWLERLGEDLASRHNAALTRLLARQRKLRHETTKLGEDLLGLLVREIHSSPTSSPSPATSRSARSGKRRRRSRREAAPQSSPPTRVPERPLRVSAASFALASQVRRCFSWLVPSESPWGSNWKSPCAEARDN
jgi:hemerythrin-like domain-containing protein